MLVNQRKQSQYKNKMPSYLEIKNCVIFTCIISADSENESKSAIINERRNPVE